MSIGAEIRRALPGSPLNLRCLTSHFRHLGKCLALLLWRELAYLLVERDI